MTAAGLGGSSRLLLRHMREMLAAGDAPQARFDRIVTQIAQSIVADVCSLYLRRQDGSLELWATEGLKREAVHRTRLKPGEGLVGLIAESAEVLSLRDAPHHPRFSYRPETGEDPFSAFLGVPVLHRGRLLGVLVVQNRVARQYEDDEAETLQTIATVLAEIVVSSDLVAGEAFSGVAIRLSGPDRIQGRRFADGLAIGEAVLHDPDVPPTRYFSDNPAAEERRLDEALAALRAGLEGLLSGEGQRMGGVSHEVLETISLLASDRGWERRLREPIRAGLTAEAAVEQVRSEHRARMQTAKDAYIRERLHDLEDLDNRLLRHLGGDAAPRRALPEAMVLVARNIGPAELLEYGPDRLKGVLLEEGSGGSHAAIVAKALGVPMVGRLSGLLTRVQDGDAVIVDAAEGYAHLRPEPEVRKAFQTRLSARAEEQAAFSALRDTPCITADGRRVTLLGNAGLALDVAPLVQAGAEGVGLFRTEFQFMVSETLPRLGAQTELYRQVLDAAGDRPVVFRTLDLGGDKVLPYMAAEREENPAMGWRAIRMTLDRPGLLRYQLRALVRAAAGKALSVMFPLVATPEEFVRARALLERELAWNAQAGRPGPAAVRVGVMVEAPALAWNVRALKGTADFVSIGTNDLMQFFFAADRGNPRVSERYDVLSCAALSFLARIREEAAAAGLSISVCGEAAGRPLEAACLIALGFDQLSMPAAGLGPVKRMALRLEAGRLRAALDDLFATQAGDLRAPLEAWARAQGLLG
jgi:phosphotransferase system enzyme I (PtsP)